MTKIKWNNRIWFFDSAIDAWLFVMYWSIELEFELV